MSYRSRTPLETPRSISSGPPPPREPDETDAIRRQIDAGEYARAMALATNLLKVERSNMLAMRLATEARTLLERRHLTQLGSALSKPRLVVAKETLATCGVDRAAQAVAEGLDGKLTIVSVLSRSGLPHVVTLRILCDLLALGVIAID